MFAFLAMAVSFSPGACAVNSQIPPEEIAKAVTKCQSCHDSGTDNTHRETPRLNGQHYQYIVNQIRNFRDPTRQDPHAINTMWPIATQTTDEMIFALANHFSSQPPTEPPRRNDALAERGRKIFMEGVPNVPACLSCHGVQGQGTDTVPRLAGQHAVYLAHAMESLRFALRESNVMHPELNNIDEDQINALVAYLARD
jgi:cytochrome c553